MENPPVQVLITDDAVIFGIIMVLLALIFFTSSLETPFWKRLYAVLPPLLLCYFIPGLFNSFGIYDGEASQLYEVSSNYLLPACLVLFTLNLDLRQLWSLRKRAGVLFLTGTIGIVIGGPLALWLVSLLVPDILGGEGADAAWRGLATLAGSWTGGGANQAALYRIFEPSSELFSAVIAVDVFVAYGWMALLLYGAGKTDKLDRYFQADASDVLRLKENVQAEDSAEKRGPEVKDLIMMLGVAFGATGLSHLLGTAIAEWISLTAPHLDKFSLTSSYFWVILLATVSGIALSFTRAKRFEAQGATKIGTVFLYILVATIGMQMDIFAIFRNPSLFLVGLIWMFIHAALLWLVAKKLKAPFFYFAIGSMANVGGVASASVTAAAFHPKLVPVGVILAVFGYAIGTYAGYLCALLMQWVSG